MDIEPGMMRPHLGETTMIEIRPSVAVVGAGLAGLTAASVLAGRGYPITVFDKARGPGGRTSTRREGDFAFDHGCQYLTVRDERFRRYLEIWAEQGAASPWHPRVANCDKGQIIPVNDDTPRWVGVPGMNALAKNLARDLDLTLATRITGITPTDGGWRLTSDPAGDDDPYEVVVVATPAEQAVPLLASVPALQTAAASVHMQPCWAVMLAFEYDLDLPFDAAFLRNSPLVWVAQNGSKPGRPGPESWVLHASPTWSRKHLEWSPEQVLPILTEAFFEAIGGKPVGPSASKAHRWRYAAPENPLGAGFLWDATRGLAACGDWCHSARAEGAFLSGLQLADRILTDCPRARRPYS